MSAAVDQMRGEQGEQAQRLGGALQPDELQQGGVAGVGDHALDDAVAPIDVGVGKLVGGDAVLQRFDNETAISFFFREEPAVVGDQQAEIAGAGLIDARVVDLVQDAVAEGEPHPADR